MPTAWVYRKQICHYVEQFFLELNKFLKLAG